MLLDHSTKNPSFLDNKEDWLLQQFVDADTNVRSCGSKAES